MSLIVAVANDGDKPVNVSGVMAYLANPEDPSGDPMNALFNFSFQAVADGMLDGGRETAVDYRMQLPSPAAGETIEAPLFATVYFYDPRAGGFLGVPAYNSSVTLLPRSSKDLDLRALMPYVMAGCLVALSAFIFFSYVVVTPRAGAVSGAVGEDGEEGPSIVPQTQGGGSRQRRVKNGSE